jgi:hypothetical protein
LEEVVVILYVALVQLLVEDLATVQPLFIQQWAEELAILPVVTDQPLVEELVTDQPLFLQPLVEDPVIARAQAVQRSAVVLLTSYVRRTEPAQLSLEEVVILF